MAKEILRKVIQILEKNMDIKRMNDYHRKLAIGGGEMQQRKTKSAGLVYLLTKISKLERI